MSPPCTALLSSPHWGLQERFSGVPVQSRPPVITPRGLLQAPSREGTASLPLPSQKLGRLPSSCVPLLSPVPLLRPSFCSVCDNCYSVELLPGTWQSARRLLSGNRLD